MHLRTRRSRFLPLAMAVLFAAGSKRALADDGTWTNTLGGSWSDPANWLNGIIPTASGDTATFPTQAPAQYGAVTLDGNHTLTSLILNAPYSLQQGSSGTLTFAGTQPTFQVNFTQAGGTAFNLPIELDANTTFQAASTSLVFNGPITGTGTLQASGVIVLAGSNSYGNTVVPGGQEIDVGNAGITGTLGTGPVQDNGRIFFARTDAYTVPNIFTGAGTLSQTQPGTLTLTGTGSSVGTVILAGGGILRIGADNAITASSFQIGGSGSTLDLNGHALNTNAIVQLFSGGLIDNSAATPATLNLNLIANNVLNLSIINTGGPLSVVKAGGGTLTLASQNSYTGHTSITNGVLFLASTGTLSPNGEIDVATPRGLQLDAGVSLSTPILLQPGLGFNEFVNVPAGNATLAGNISIAGTQNNPQFLLGILSAGTLTVTGASTILPGQIAMITRGNVILGSLGSITASTDLALGTVSGGILNFTLSGNATINTLLPADSEGLNMGRGASSAVTVNFTIRDAAVATVGAGGVSNFNLDAQGTTSGNKTFNLLGGSLVVGGFMHSSASTDPVIGTTTVNLNGGTIVAGRDNPAFIPVLSGTGIYPGTLGAKFNLQAHAITVSQPIIANGGLNDGGLLVSSSSGAGTLTLAGFNTYKGPTTLATGAILNISTNANLGDTGAGAPIVFSGGTLRTSSSIALDDKANALTHRYSFNDGTPNDSAGTANGTILGSVSIGNGVATFGGGSTNATHITLPPTSGDNNVNNLSAINLNLYHAATFMVWFRMPVAALQGNNLFAEFASFGGRAPAGNGVGYVMLASRHASGEVRAFTSSSVSPQLGAPYETGAATPAPITDTNEHMLTAVLDSGALSLYIDGILQQITPLSLTNGGFTFSKISTQLASIGGSTFSQDPAFTGTIDEVRIYNTALSASEINTATNAGPNSVVTGGSASRNITLLPAGGSIDLPNANTLTLSGIISGSGPLALTGTGDLLITGAADYSGPTSVDTFSTVEFSGGVSHSVGALAGPGKIQIDAGAFVTSDGVLINALTLNGTHTIRSNGSSSNTSKLSHLALATGTAGNFTATLNLTDNKLILQSTTPADKQSKITMLNAALTAGSNGGTWTGNGITSSTAANDANHYAVGLFDNASLNKTSFGGQSVDASSLLVTIAHLGDANDNGIVDFQDLTIIANNWQKPALTWSEGDLNRDGIVDFQDLTIVANNWQQTSNFNQAASALAAFDGTITAIPEPATLPCLVFAVATLLGRRRKSLRPL